MHEWFAKDSAEESLEQGGFQSALDTKPVGYLEPSCVEEELEEGEDRNVQIQVMPRVAFGGIQELPSNEAREEERVDREGDNLGRRETRGRGQCWLPTETMRSGQVGVKKPRAWDVEQLTRSAKHL